MNNTIKYIRLLVFIKLLLFSSYIIAQDTNFHIYLCFGQSNMEGQGKIEAQDTRVDNRFQVMASMDCDNLCRKKGEWYTAVSPLSQCYAGLSPADYFGRTLVAELPDSITVGVINVAIGGCDIRLFDKDQYLDYDSKDGKAWFANKVKGYGGNPYECLIELAKQAQKNGVIKGVLLHQGETNTGDTQWPMYVKKIYDDMLKDLSLKAVDIPLLAGELVSEPDNCCSTMNPIINTLPDVLLNAHVISSEGCPAMDRAHFNSEGYRMIGKRYAEKMLSLLKEHNCED
ncbi:sialate O-acetylesterase [Carboxylicivirga sp. N1Y90]|uniref:sialate O-acetylesterase n=1 Tax=Carboxylicivirga fragile TaxID=3417571 RepID=UPI003D329051|nr:sialate O-acetylesterase [Marinilabiliaceae bacterium N1Y90]